MLFDKKVKFFFLFLSLFLLLGINFVYALEINYPTISIPDTFSPQQCITKSPEEVPSCYIKYIIYLVIFISLALTVVILVIGGTRYIFFSGSAQGIASAKNQISSVFIGLLILFISILVIKTINPKILVFELPGLPSIIVSPPPNLSPPPSEKPRTLINVELPFGTIIEERIFEIEAPQGRKSRMERIKDIAFNTLIVAGKLKEKSEYLKNLTLESRYKCSCEYTTPSGDSCSGDPCKDIRKEIQNTEINNLKLIGIEIQNLSSSPISPYLINLIFKQKEAVREVRILKEETNKLLRTEAFMLDCGLSGLNSLSDSAQSKDYFESNNWIIFDVKFWKNILLDINKDYATFYCPVSGTILGELPDDFASEGGINLSNQEIMDSPKEIEKSTCEEVSIGKIIDRAIRLSNKLVERMEKLTNLSKDMATAVDGLHILISQCTSQNCDYSPGAGGDPTGEQQCTGDPCPNEDIIEQTEKIQYIFEEIRIVAEGPISREEREKVGIIPIIQEVIPGLLEDITRQNKDEKKGLLMGIKKQMEMCVTDVQLEGLTERESDQPSKILSSCQESIGNLSEQGKIIQECHLTMKEELQKEFVKCLNQCYLEKNYREHKRCLENCLSQKTSINIEEIKTYYHSIDFFCCEN